MRTVTARNPRFWLCTFGVALVLLRLVYAFTLRVNSDEPQHLHVVWAWTQGLLPYRDVFDNHTPLFQLLCAPLFALIGERAEILPLMRIATLPWFALALWCTYRIGRRLYDARTGAWAALLTGVAPGFFILMAQFRTDVGWAPLWLATVMVAIEGRPTPRRAFVVGLLAGATCAVSLKSLLLLGTLGVASVLVLVLQRTLAQPLPLREIARTSGAVLLGFVLIPAAIAFGFCAAGAWDAFVYCVFRHNVVPGLGHWDHLGWRAAILPVTLPPLIWVAREILRRDAQPERGAKRAFVLLAAVLYVATLMSFWPLITRQDLLPFRPLLSVYVVALLLALPASRGWRLHVPLRLLLPLAVECAMLLNDRPPWRDQVHRYVSELRDVLRLTDRNDYVMDLKGESIFRRRPYYYALEQITLTRIELGLLTEDIPASLIATSTAVVLSGPDEERLTEPTLAFIAENYVPVRRRIRVAGTALPPAAAGATQRFEIVLPLTYAVRSGDAAFEGEIDGRDYTGPLYLAAGVHEIRARHDGAVTLVWSQALERGFAPAATLSAPVAVLPASAAAAPASARETTQRAPTLDAAARAHDSHARSLPIAWSS